MTDSPFDDQSFLNDLPKKQNPEAGEPAESIDEELQSPRSLERFSDEDLFDELPEEQAPLYPEILSPHKDTPSPKRPLPWPIDIFLYPINRTGILNLAITFGVPVIMVLVTLGCIAIAGTAPLFILVAVPLAIAAAIATLLMCLYFGWYVTECVRSSSEGNIRAPDTVGQTPGIMELFALCFQVFLCGMVFMGMSWSIQATVMPPAWAQYTLDTTLGLILPMTLLSIISLDSIRGLNPLLNLRLIAVTFVPYFGMAIPLYLAHRVLFWGCLKMPNPQGIITLALCEVYGAMVSAHILGRFAWKQQDKLIWE